MCPGTCLVTCLKQAWCVASWGEGVCFNWIGWAAHTLYLYAVRSWCRRWACVCACVCCCARTRTHTHTNSVCKHRCTHPPPAHAVYYAQGGEWRVGVPVLPAVWVFSMCLVGTQLLPGWCLLAHSIAHELLTAGFWTLQGPHFAPVGVVGVTAGVHACSPVELCGQLGSGCILRR